MKTIDEIKTTVSYITWAEFAELCRLTPRTINRWRSNPAQAANLPKSRELPGGREVIMVHDLMEWYYQHEEGIKAHRSSS